MCPGRNRYEFLVSGSCWIERVVSCIYMNGVVPEVNARVLGNGLELLCANGGRFEINQLLFADDTALVADSEDKLCGLVIEFGTVCEKELERECWQA